jgi:hypothetical protein
LNTLNTKIVKTWIVFLIAAMTRAGNAEDTQPANEARDQAPPEYRERFLSLCDLACRELNTDSRAKIPFYWDSYAVRALCVAHDLTGDARYLKVCKAWADRMVAYQEKMVPTGAYYIHYHRQPGESAGQWYVADSSSIALGVLTTAVRCDDPAEKARYLNSVKSFARLVMDNYIGPGGGIQNGLWTKYEGEWWCSSGIFGSVALLLSDVTGDNACRKVGLGALDWLNRMKMSDYQLYPLAELGATMPMYILETYSTAMGHLDREGERPDLTLKRWREALDWMAANQGKPHEKTQAYSAQWGSKFGGLPFHMYVYARHVPGSEAVRQAADREMEYIARELERSKQPGLSQLASFAMISYAERLSPGALYRSQPSTLSTRAAR